MRGRFTIAWLRAAFAAGAVLVLSLCAAVPAAAHAQLVHADPSDGAVVAAMPEKLTLTFSEPVSPLVLKLVLPGGDTLALSPAAHDRTLVIDPPATRARGTYALSWRVVSADGHPVGGTVLFSVGAPGGANGLPQAAGSGVGVALWFVKLVLYAAMFFGVGGVCFRALVASPNERGRWLYVMLAAGLVAAVVSVGLQGLDALGLGLQDLVAAQAWQAGFATSYGLSAALAVLAFAAALGGAVLRAGLARSVLSIVAIASLGLALAASGHASAASPQWLTRPAVFVHGVGIALWAGALVPLALLLRSERRPPLDALRRFSRGIPLVVGALIVAGVALAIVQVGTPSALWQTSYGRVMLAKLALLAVVFAIAVHNRWWLTAPALKGSPDARHRLERAIRVEIVLFLLVFAVAALWRFTPPPRALAAAQESTMVHIHTPRAMVELTIAPDDAGPVTASILVMTADFQPMAVKEVTLSLALPQAGIEPIERSATLRNDGMWEARLTIPKAGRWSARIGLLVTDFEQLSVEQDIAIGERPQR